MESLPGKITLYFGLVGFAVGLGYLLGEGAAWAMDLNDEDTGYLVGIAMIFSGLNAANASLSVFSRY